MIHLKNLTGALIVILIIVLPVFSHLSELPVQSWDESRLAVNALEMSKTHNWLVPSFSWRPDMWNTKPPLFIWLQVISIKLLGTNEVALRLPAALAAVATCLFLYWFLSVKLRNLSVGIIAPALLVISEGYVTVHGTRTGDYDSLLTMFTTMSLLYFYLYLKEQEPKYLLLTFVALSLGCLTKGVAALMFLPGMFIMAIWHKQLKNILTSKAFYIGSGLFLLWVPGYYLLREQYNPGYIAAVAENELGGRFLTVIEKHQKAWYFYFEQLYRNGAVFLALSVWGTTIAFRPGDKHYKNLSLHLTTAALTFLLIISFAQTKIEWYTLPVYPLLAILGAMAIDDIMLLVKRINTHQIVKNILVLIPFTALYVAGYINILSTVMKPQIDYTYNPNALTAYLREGIKGTRERTRTKILYGEYMPDLMWYEATNKHLSFSKIMRLEPGDTVPAYLDESIDIIEKNYEYRLLEKYHGINIYQIISRKLPAPPAAIAD